MLAVAAAVLRVEQQLAELAAAALAAMDQQETLLMVLLELQILVAVAAAAAGYLMFPMALAAMVVLESLFCVTQVLMLI
jgi:hypothetical protein